MRRTCVSASAGPIAGPSSTSVAVTGTISSVNRPPSIAAIARWWLRSAKASCSSREMLASRAWFSATRPVAEIDVGVAVDQRRIRRDFVAAHRHEAHRLGAAGDDGRRGAAHDVLGGVGNRLKAGRTEAVDGDSRGVTGMPARRLAIRATFMPCSASGIAQPRMTSSTSAGSMPGARLSASAITTAARSSGRVPRSVPSGALPDGGTHRRNDDGVIHHRTSRS